ATPGTCNGVISITPVVVAVIPSVGVPRRSGGSRTLRGDRRRARALRRVRVDDVVERVAFDRLAACGSHETFELTCGHRLGRARAGHVVNLLFLHGAVEIVDAEPQRGLRYFHPGRN